MWGSWGETHFYFNIQIICSLLYTSNVSPDKSSWCVVGSYDSSRGVAIPKSCSKWVDSNIGDVNVMFYLNPIIEYNTAILI
jgi:hypothetical protein